MSGENTVNRFHPITYVFGSSQETVSIFPKVPNISPLKEWVV